ncbi:hypothetical protein AK830_g10153 [Neonectria ditissima]|uniref:Uncharacterized protein n=1 Tax=Neonectria ditissima TaxID=78410 RepID=A0A0N8H5K4_9HYPO|nr:hypothetical protein AK830_g10153 [Neonectria ditissima]
METTKAASSSLAARPFLRHKAVVVFAAAATAATVAFRYRAAAFNHNDVEQRTRKAPHGYVSVDRSGGGI